MNRFKTKKGLALLAALVVVGASAFGAYAYFTTTGTGTGSATVASSNGITLVITGGSTDATGLVPGGSVAISNGKIHNGGTQEAGAAGTVTGTVSTTQVGCDATWFSVDNVVEPAGTSIAAGGDLAFATTLHMSNPTGVDQNGCKGAPLKITWGLS